MYAIRSYYARVIAKVPALLWNRLVRGRAVDVVLTHAPPRGVHDRADRCHSYNFV